MKVLPIKGIEDMGSRWGVRYTRQHGRNVQDAYFLCDTLDEAKEKFKELLDVLMHHDGVYIGVKEKSKAKTTRRGQGG